MQKLNNLPIPAPQPGPDGVIRTPGPEGSYQSPVPGKPAFSLNRGHDSLREANDSRPRSLDERQVDTVLEHLGYSVPEQPEEAVDQAEKSDRAA